VKTTYSSYIAESGFARSIRTGLLIPLLLATACNTAVKRDSTLTSLDQIDITIRDEKVDDSLHKAMQSYREYIDKAPAATMKPEAIQRLAELEVQQSFGIDGVESPLQPGARAAIDHYTRLLTTYPLYDHNDRVLYQLSRAYEEAGENAHAVETLEQLASRYPEFARMDEVKFRLGEHYFRDKQYRDANRAYDAVLGRGKDSVYYTSALKKQGWSYFKQERYNQALTYFIAVLDHITAQEPEPVSAENGVDRMQIDEAHRPISLSFSYLGGAEAIKAYINQGGNSRYEQVFYQQLAEYYLSKDRFTDAAKTYQAYIDQYPLSAASASYGMRIIEIYQLGGFYDLATNARKNFDRHYGPGATYWKQADSGGHSVSMDYQKNNIRTLASTYHARFQQLQDKQARQDSYHQAAHWYREYYYRFPLDEYAPQMSKLLAELYLENGDYHDAALEFERIAKNDPAAEIAADSAYAAIFAYRENLKTLPESRRRAAREHLARRSLWFAENYPQHAETGAVLTAAAYDFLTLKNHSAASDTANRVISQYAASDPSQMRSAWIVLADAQFESGRYAEAEESYQRILSTTAPSDEKYQALTENLAASVYQQAEYARKDNDHNKAAEHFMRLETLAPNTRLSASAQYEAASSLAAIGEWSRAAVVLEEFQQQNPDHELAEVTTRNLAAIYRKNDDLLKSAGKLEHVASNDDDPVVRREALLQAAELYAQADIQDDALRVYRQYVQRYSSPAEAAIEAYQKIADIYRSKHDTRNYHATLRKIIAADEKAGNERTDRTRYLAAGSLLVLAESSMQQFKAVELTRPFKKNLELKKKRMSTAIEQLTRLLGYQVSETTTAATFYIAEIYLHFSQALTGSERPTGLSDIELEQYELALEEQAYMFEEKAISVYEKNTELLDAGIHDPWIDKSIDRLSALFPAQYAKQEQKSGYLKSLFAADDRT